MGKVEVRVEPVERFFDRVKMVARRADQGRPVPQSHVIAFEDVEDMLALMSEKRMQLLKAVKQEPGSIADLARRLRRDRAAVTRDVQQLARFGVIDVSDRPLRGHGRQKWVSTSAQSIELVAQI